MHGWNASAKAFGESISWGERNRWAEVSGPSCEETSRTEACILCNFLTQNSKITKTTHVFVISNSKPHFIYIIDALKQPIETPKSPLKWTLFWKSCGVERWVKLWLMVSFTLPSWFTLHPIFNNIVITWCGGRKGKKIFFWVISRKRNGWYPLYIPWSEAFDTWCRGETAHGIARCATVATVSVGVLWSECLVGNHFEFFGWSACMIFFGRIKLQNDCWKFLQLPTWESRWM